MLKHWPNLLATDCKVVKVKDSHLYPIYRNGSTSLYMAQSELLVNEQIAKCKHIEIIIRDPASRFVSGINEYSRTHKLEIMQTWQDVKSGLLMDRHFAPQVIWLLHLYKFYKGTVTLRDFNTLSKYTEIHKAKFPGEKTAIPVISELVDADHKLIPLMNKTSELGDIVEEFKDVLS